MKLTTCTQNPSPSRSHRSVIQQPSHFARAVLRLAALLFVVLVTRASLQAQSNYATPYTFATLAGDVGYGSTDGVGSAARFRFPLANAVDSLGNVYVADTFNHLIRRITPAGVVSTVAGMAGTSGSADGTGSTARFDTPSGVAVDNAGNLYVADTYNFTVRKITIDADGVGTVTTLAGTAGAHGHTDGTSNAARFNSTYGLAVNSSGDVYVADSGNSLIRKISAAGEVTTLAGVGGPNSPGSTDGVGRAAQFNWPLGLALNASGDVLYVADGSNHTIRKIVIDADGVGTVSTLAGLPGTTGTADGAGSAARFNYPDGLAVDDAGNLYASDASNNTIRKITIDAGGIGTVTTLAGTAGTSGSANGVGGAVSFSSPRGLATDRFGNLYAVDHGNHMIRRVTLAGAVSNFAGRAGDGSADGMGSEARFYFPTGLAAASSGDVYVADRNNNTIRKITADGVVTTVAGVAGSPGTADGTGGAARFNFPSGVALGSSDAVYVADRNNHTIRKITSDGIVTTFAGSAGSSGTADGKGSAARFSSPNGVAADGSGNLYIADRGNHTIRKITAGGEVTTLAGLAGNSGTADGTGSAARFSTPTGVAVDSLGNVYVAELGNHTIRMITSSGEVTTLAGTAGTSGTADGVGRAARFNQPYGVAVDSAGNVYVAGYGDCTIRRITPSGAVTTLAGVVNYYDTVNGTGSVARFRSPTGVAVDTLGNLYVAEFGCHLIRKGARQHAYAWFLDTYFTDAQQADATVSGRDANPSGDGMPNLLKYAIGLDPTLTNAATGAPVSTISDGHLTLSFPQWTDATDLHYVVEVSDDLVTWSSDASAVAIEASTPIGPNQVRVTARDLATASDAARRFIRLRVTAP